MIHILDQAYESVSAPMASLTSSMILARVPTHPCTPDISYVFIPAEFP